MLWVSNLDHIIFYLSYFINLLTLHRLCGNAGYVTVLGECLYTVAAKATVAPTNCIFQQGLHQTCDQITRKNMQFHNKKSCLSRWFTSHSLLNLNPSSRKLYTQTLNVWHIYLHENPQNYPGFFKVNMPAPLSIWNTLPPTKNPVTGAKWLAPGQSRYISNKNIPRVIYP